MILAGERFRRLSVAGVMAGLVWSGSVAQAETSLAQAVLRGVQRHPEVRVAEAEVSMAETEVALSRNAYLPALSASAGPAAAGVGYDVTLSQTVYDWGQAGGQVDQKRAQLLQQQANLQVVRDDVALEIAEVYLDVASTRAQLSLLDEHLEQLAALAEMANQRVEGRYADQAESGRVALAMATAQGNQARYRGALAQAVDHYDLLLDQAPTGLSVPEPEAFLEKVRDEGALEAAVASSPLYRKAALGIDVADAGVRESRAARFPRVALEGSVQRREIGGRMVDDSAIALRLRLGTQQGLSAIQRPRLEAQRKQAAAMNAEAVARDLQRTVGSLSLLDQALEQRIAALSDQAAQAGSIREVYREQFLVGRRDIQDLVIMETEHFEAERQIIELTLERLRLQYRAAAQLGMLVPAMAGDEMQPPVELF